MAHIFLTFFFVRFRVLRMPFIETAYFNPYSIKICMGRQYHEFLISGPYYYNLPGELCDQMRQLCSCSATEAGPHYVLKRVYLRRSYFIIRENISLGN